MKKTPRLTVVIPTLNEERYIGTVLSDLRLQTHLPDEVLVVDGGSTDATQRIVKTHKHATFIQADKPVGNQRSHGGNLAKGSIIMFLDADVHLDPTFIENALAEFQSRSLSCACPAYKPFPGSFSIRLFYEFFNMIFWMTQHIKASGAGSCIIVTRKLFNSIGGFSASYTYDDIVFIRQAGERGRFGILKTPIHVSDRRIRKDGMFKTLWIYSILTLLFACNAYKLSNRITYPFGHF